MDAREIFRITFKLMKDQPWVTEKGLEQLLFDDCKSDLDREMIVDLISRFFYLDHKSYADHVDSLALSIIEDPDLSEGSTQIVAMAGDRGSDSSQYLLYDLKRVFERLEWRSYRHVNRYDKAYDTYKNSNDHKNIVLIDEFIGSGSTAEGRVNTIRRRFHDAGISEYSIRVRVIAASSVGIEYLKSKEINVESLVTLDKGISDHYASDDVANKLALMENIEALLSQRFNGREMPSLGYGKTETLYCRERGNTPNSVFPIFWWPFYRDERRRKTLLIRAMGDA